VVTAPTSPLAAEALFRVGEFHYDAGQFADAAKSYGESLAKPTLPELKEKTLHKLGWCQFKQNDFKTAAATFERQVTDFSKGDLAGDGLFLAAECYFNQDQWAAAYERYAKVAVAKHPRYHAQSLFRAGQCAGSLKNWPASASHYTELITGFTKFAQLADARYGLGWALQNQHKMAEAIAAYEKVTEETDSETAAKARFMIGECYFAQKQHEQAIEHYLRAAFGYSYELWAGNAHFEAARCFEVLKQRDQAKQSYRTIVEKYPKHEKAKLAAERLKELRD
jgi:TolA-binding protein